MKFTQHLLDLSVYVLAMDETISQRQSATQPVNKSSTSFHTMAATNAFKRYRDRTSSWTEYQESTIALMMRIVYKSLTLALNPFVVAMTDNIRGITDCIESVPYGQGFEQGSLTVGAMYVQWKDNGIGSFAGIRPGDANIGLDEHNLSAVLRLLKQRSGSDTVLVMMADMSRHGAGSQVLETTQATAGVELGINTTPLGKQPEDLLHVRSAQTPIRAVSSKQTAARSPQKPIQATTASPNSENGHERTEEGKKSSGSVKSTSRGRLGSESLEEGEAIKTPINLTSPQDRLTKHRLPPKLRQPARRSSPNPRFPQSFHDAQREAEEKRKHRHSSGSEDNARHRQKVDDSPETGRRDRRRDDPYGFG